MTKSISSLTKQLFELNGYFYDKAEHWNHFSKKKKDLFNFADAVAIGPDCISALQITTLSHAGARKEKIEAIPAAHRWATNGQILLVCWRPLKVGGRSRLCPRVERFDKLHWTELPFWQEWYINNHKLFLAQKAKAPEVDLA